MASKEIKGIKNDWICFAEWYDLYWFHSPYIYGLYTELKKNVGYACENQVWEYKNGVQRYYISQSEWNKISQRYFNQIKKEPKLLARALRAIEAAATDLFSFNKRIKGINFASSSWNKIVTTFAKWHRLHYNLWCLGMVPNLLELNNTLLSSYLTEYLDSRRKANHPRAQEIFRLLTTPKEWSFNQREEHDFLSLVAKYQKNTKLKKGMKSKEGLEEVKEILRKDFKECWQELVNHYKIYYWLPYSWIGPAWEIDYFVDLFKRMLNKKGLAEKAGQMKKQQNELLSVKKDWINKLNIDDDQQKLFELMTGIIHAKVVRMDALYQSYCFIKPLLKQAAKEFNISLKQLYIIHDGDLVEILKKRKFPVKQANEMLGYSIYRAEDGDFKLYTGQAAQKIMKPILNSLPKLKDTRELSGECGCPGKARGTVRIITIPEEMQKMKKGDILVSQITNPSLVPAMKKAAAVVTDTGGLTCHAAIVSRELDIPCVIGTKIATQVLKDGALLRLMPHMV